MISTLCLFVGFREPHAGNQGLPEGSDGSGERSSLGLALQEVAGALPAWHPRVLTMLLARGRLGAVAAALRQLLKVLEEVQTVPQRPCSGE